MEDMYDYINKIINEIETQRCYMIERYGINPNKIILGSKIYTTLSNAYGAVRLTNKELCKSGITATVVDLPVTVDYEDIYTIEVCFELEKSTRNLISLSK